MAISKEFVLAGDATLTIEVPDGCRPENGKPHYTFRVQKVEASDRWPESYFVKLLTGPDNTKSYSYVGKLEPFTGQVNLTQKSKFGAEAFVVRLINHVLARVWGDDHEAYEKHGFHAHHEGKCGRCGRKLTTPKSVTSGVGPECAKILGVA